MNTPLKILCLPGWRTSSNIMKKQLEFSLFAQNLEDLVEFISINPTLPAQGKPQPIIEKLDKEGKYYQWWYIDESKPNIYNGLEESVEYIYKYISSNGPFDGILGFSQGGALTSYIAALSEQNTKFSGLFKFVVLVATFPPNDDKFKELIRNTGTLKTPSLHCIGKIDELYNYSLLCSNLYHNPSIIEHEKGHIFPKLEGARLSKLRAFLRQFKPTSCRI